MLEGGTQPPSKTPRFKGMNITESRIFSLGTAGSLVAIGLALILGWLNSGSEGIWPIVAQCGVGLLVVGFVVWSFRPGPEQQAAESDWLRGALICGGLVGLTALFTGPYFNIMLAPLLVGLAQRRDDQLKVVQLGLGVVGLVAVELLVFYSLGWQRTLGQTAGTTSLIAIAALTLAVASLMHRYQGQVDQYRLEAQNKASEMEVAHEIQTSLMPPGEFTSGSWTLAARSLPAKDVGGDFYEYVQHPHLSQMISGIAIGDVAGKGIPAALQMAVVRTLFRVEARRRIFPGETLMSVNMALQAERSFGMVTMLYAFIDITTNTLHMANAGHNYPLILNGTLDEVKMPGLPLGIDDSIEYEEKVIKITPGTSVIFYTDGVPEAMDTDGQLYTFERFKEAVCANKTLAPDEMVEKLLAEIASFTNGAAQSDDITLLVLQYHPQTDQAVLDLEAVASNTYSDQIDEPPVEISEEDINWI